MSARLLIALTLSLGFPAFAQNAQDELERQLKEMVGKPPTKLLIEYEGLDQPNYKLAEVTFELDGSSLPVPSLEKLNGEGKQLIFHGDVKPGKHSLETTVVLTDVAGALFSYEAGYKWKVKNTRSFEQAPGLEVHVVITPELNPGEKDPKKKFLLKSTAVPKMLAKLEDGSMPDVPKPNLAKKEEADAGVAVAELSPAEKAKILKEQQAEEARAKKLAAMEEAKRKKEEAAAAKAAAAEEKKRKREEALAAAKAAKDEKARQKAEALAAAKAAAEEKKHPKTEVAKAPVEGSPPSEPPPSQPPPTEPVAEVVDAGAPAVAAVQTPKPAQPAEVAKTETEGGGFPLPIIIGVGVALLGIIIFLATRKKKDAAPY